MSTADILLLVLLAATALFALRYLPLQRAREAEEKRKRQLTAEYADMVTGLCLLMTAGLSLRASWERIVRDYRKEQAAGGEKSLVAEEMAQTEREILGGVFEDRAYSSFGRRCGTAEYLRLGSLLETYVRQGNRELMHILEQEAASSLQVELREVKKRGEKTAELLLLPTILLFGITLLLVAVPAFMQITGNI